MPEKGTKKCVICGRYVPLAEIYCMPRQKEPICSTECFTQYQRQQEEMMEKMRKATDQLYQVYSGGILPPGPVDTKQTRYKPSSVKDLTGMRFGKLEVISRAENDKNRHARWLCKCDCGNYDIVSSTALLNGGQFSCGCDGSRAHFGELSTRHGESDSRLYSIWKGAKQRCFNPNNRKYYLYGARGITMCDAWSNDYVVFRDWALANGYRDDLTLDRIDGTGNYEPGNCRWATYAEQNRNRNFNWRTKTPPS